MPHVDAVVGELMGTPSDLVLGRTTYDIVRAFWPTASADERAGVIDTCRVLSFPVVLGAGRRLLGIAPVGLRLS